MSEMTDANGKGFFAASEGKPKTENPYPLGTPTRAMWDMGWDEAAQLKQAIENTCHARA